MLAFARYSCEVYMILQILRIIGIKSTYLGNLELLELAVEGICSSLICRACRVVIRETLYH